MQWATTCCWLWWFAFVWSRRFLWVGAYAAGLALKQLDVGLIAGMAAAITAAAVLGAFVAAFISHRRGIYYALMTIAFGQLAWFVSIKWHSVTGGEDGLLNIPRRLWTSVSCSYHCTDARRAFLFRVGAVLRDRVGALVSDRHALRACARRRQAERDACGVLRTQRLARQVHRVRDVVRDCGDGRRAVRAGTTIGVSERDESQQLGLCRDDGANQADGQLLGTCYRRGVLHRRA